jgi:hypothetical protein
VKIESRGKYPGVKVHLEPEEVEVLLNFMKTAGSIDSTKRLVSLNIIGPLAAKMGMKIQDLLAEDPTVLQPRTPEQIVAILAKESEKQRLQLEAMKSGKDWKKLDPVALETALLKHAK